MVIKNWPEDAWKVISLKHSPPADLKGESALGVLQKIWYVNNLKSAQLLCWLVL